MFGIQSVILVVVWRTTRAGLTSAIVRSWNFVGFSRRLDSRSVCAPPASTWEELPQNSRKVMLQSGHVPCTVSSFCLLLLVALRKPWWW